MKIEIQHTQTYRVSKWEGHSDKCLRLKQEKSQISNLTLHLKELNKEGQTKPMIARRKGIANQWKHMQ